MKLQYKVDPAEAEPEEAPEHCSAPEQQQTLQEIATSKQLSGDKIGSGAQPRQCLGLVRLLFWVCTSGEFTAFLMRAFCVKSVASPKELATS